MQLTLIKARDMSISQVPINSQTSYLVMYVYTAGSMCKREANNSTEPYSSTGHLGCQKLFFFLISSGTLENLQLAGWAECVNCFKSRILPLPGHGRAQPKPTQSGGWRIAGKKTLLCQTMAIQSKLHCSCGSHLSAVYNQ